MGEIFNGKGNVDVTELLSNLMQQMDMMNTKIKEQDEKIEDLKEKVNILEEENATFRKKMNEKEKTEKEAGQPQSEKTSFKKPENSRLINSIEEFDESIDPIAHFVIRRAYGEFDEFYIRRTNPKDGEKKIYKYFKEQKSFGETKNINIEEIKQAIADGNCFIIEDTCHLKTSQEEEVSLGNKLNVRVNGCFLATTMVSLFEEEATNAVVNEASKSLKWYIPPSSAKEAHVCMHTKTICKNASQKLGNRGSLSKILKHKKTSSVAKTASKESLKKSAIANLLITGGIEGAFAVYDLHQLSKKNLSEKDYNREFNKTVSGAVGATVGSLAAGTVGQVLCPIPVLGYALGSMIGNYGGRWLASEMAS